MHATHAIRRLIASGEDRPRLGAGEAQGLAAAMLDGGVPELELGALLVLLEQRITAAELLGCAAALAQRCCRLRPPSGAARPVVFASYHGTRAQPNLVPLLVLVLQRLGVPVLVHGALDGAGGVASAYVFRELGIMPCVSYAQVQAQLDQGRPVFVPTAVLAPGLAGLLALRSRLGRSRFALLLARLLAPFHADALYVIPADGLDERALLREVLVRADVPALLLEGTEGEPFANPRCRPQIEYLDAGGASILFKGETGAAKQGAARSGIVDAQSTAGWIRCALAGEASLPLPVVNQLACCLYGAGYAQDMNQAKAIIAVESGSLLAS
jgi:anthranilate phosphoribosyltransferase